VLCYVCRVNQAMHSERIAIVRDGEPAARVRRVLCCSCWVKEGNPPADWHPMCMEAKREAGDTRCGMDFCRAVLNGEATQHHPDCPYSELYVAPMTLGGLVNQAIRPATSQEQLDALEGELKRRGFAELPASSVVSVPDARFLYANAHAYLDWLMANWAIHTHGLFSHASIMDLAKWTSDQRENPCPGGIECKCQAFQPSTASKRP
jgi:hypothetical protein